MPSFIGFNWIDALILLVLAFGLAIGYAQGLLRQIFGIAALYIAMVLAAQYFFAVAGFIRSIFTNAPIRIVNAVGFFIILIAIVTLINFLAADAYRSTRLEIFPLLDNLGGSALGLMTQFIFIIVAIPVLAFATSEPLPYLEPTRILIVQGLEGSRFVPVFVALKPVLLNVLSPWLPGGLPAILSF